MDKITDYKAIVASRLDELERRVMSWMKEGYVPQGGMSSDNDWYYQAMVKYEEKKD